MPARILLASTGALLAERGTWARSPWQRARGLIGRPPLRSGEALIIDGARQVHTFGVPAPIDVIFCDRRWTVMKIVRSMRPMRIGTWVARARYVVELPDGSVGDEVGSGDRLIVTDR